MKTREHISDLSTGPLLTHNEVFDRLAQRVEALRKTTGSEISILITGCETTPEAVEFAENLNRFFQSRNLDGVVVTCCSPEQESHAHLKVHVDSFSTSGGLPTQPKGLLAGAKSVEEMQKIMDAYEQSRQHQPYHSTAPADADVVVIMENFSRMQVEGL